MKLSVNSICTGYPSLDHISLVRSRAHVGETAIITRLSPGNYYGGCVVNVAYRLAKLGHSPGLSLVVGTDFDECGYRSHLLEAGVDLTGVIKMSGALTSRSFLFISPDGECQNFFYPGAADMWKGEALPLPDLTQCRLAIMTVGAPHHNKVFHEHVTRLGIPLLLQFRMDEYSFSAEDTRQFLATSDYLLLNNLEACYVAEMLGLKSIDELSLVVKQAVVVTSGASGMTVHTKDGKQHVPAVRASKVVDTTGAGDAFTAGFAARVLEGSDLPDAARFGATLASFAIEEMGSQTNMPERTVIEKRIEGFFNTSEPTSSSLGLACDPQEE